MTKRISTLTLIGLCVGMFGFKANGAESNVREALSKAPKASAAQLAEIEDSEFRLGMLEGPDPKSKSLGTIRVYLYKKDPKKNTYEVLLTGQTKPALTGGRVELVSIGAQEIGLKFMRPSSLAFLGKGTSDVIFGFIAPIDDISRGGRNGSRIIYDNIVGIGGKPWSAYKNVPFDKVINLDVYGLKGSGKLRPGEAQ